MKTKDYYVYIMASLTGTLYIGVTNNLMRRVFEHKHNVIPGFTQRYQCHRLVYFEQTNDIYSALNREKQIKKWRRKKKEELIKTINSHWNDLGEDWR